MSSSKDHDSNPTCLFHLRTGHISEPRLTEVRNRSCYAAQAQKLDFYDHYIIRKRRKVSFRTGLYRIKGIYLVTLVQICGVLQKLLSRVDLVVLDLYRRLLQESLSL